MSIMLSISGHGISLPMHGKCHLEHGERIFVHDTSLLGHGYRGEFYQ
jgi:hypothetical protein